MLQYGKLLGGLDIMKKTLIEFPHEFTTNRLRIRLPLPGDGQVVQQAIEYSQADLKPWLAFAKEVPTKEFMEANIREAHAEFLLREDLRLHIFHKESGEFIGSTGLHRINWDARCFEIGYWIDSRHSGKGYMMEAVEGLTNFAFNELKANRVEIRCDSKNIRSKRIPEKLGFVLEGILRNNSLAIHGEGLRDTCVFAKVRN